MADTDCVRRMIKSMLVFFYYISFPFILVVKWIISFILIMIKILHLDTFENSETVTTYKPPSCRFDFKVLIPQYTTFIVSSARTKEDEEPIGNPLFYL